MRMMLLALPVMISPIVLFAAINASQPEANGEKRELLANHETVGVFEGVDYRLCKGRTALCPDKCGDSGEFATFKIKKYLKFEKVGQYGDPKQDNFLIQVSDFDKKAKGDPKILKTVKGLKKGDFVLLSWHHDYVTKAGASYPERPIVTLEAISKEKAEALSAPAAPDEKQKEPGEKKKKGEQSKRTLDDFQKTLEKTFTPAKTVATFGEPDRRLGSGLIIFEYDLNDGTKLRLGFPGFAPIQYAHHVQNDEKSVELPLK